MVGQENGHDPDLYRRLGVADDAPREEIVRAYRRLAHEAHPDARPGDPDAPRRFRELTDAYDVLSDPRKRTAYDRSRAAGAPRGPASDAGRRRPEAGWSGAAMGREGPVPTPPIRIGPVRVEPLPGAAGEPGAAGAAADALAGPLLRRWLSALVALREVTGRVPWIAPWIGSDPDVERR